MANIRINDLEVDQVLDAKAQVAIQGGIMIVRTIRIPIVRVVRIPIVRTYTIRIPIFRTR